MFQDIIQADTKFCGWQQCSYHPFMLINKKLHYKKHLCKTGGKLNIADLGTSHQVD